MAMMNMPITRPIRRPVLSVLYSGDIYVREGNIAEGRAIIKLTMIHYQSGHLCC